MFEEEPRKECRGSDIYMDHGLVKFRIAFVESPHRLEGSVIDEEPYFNLMGFDLGFKEEGGIFIGKIHGKNECLNAILSEEFERKILEAIFSSRGEDKMNSIGGKLSCEFSTDSGGSASDKGPMIFQRSQTEGSQGTLAGVEEIIGFHDLDSSFPAKAGS